ncbi:hypothetical protein CERZMDRAFT_104765 [Cercospora zeae-maydis SCOH1-5]|uniref:Uncharacterized protein n=1 Tax=Cercospora zeae-maydis SCOH1-5 TaxID=717836 RepID=A0A6A6FT02_9PEZI|nr:hypothetical protein CERZMDRAFT_104765 [Cercospora zeae-maydis SCOH1-5]
MPSALVDAGDTPLWFPPASVLEESSLRSTLLQNDKAEASDKQTSTPNYMYTALKAANHLPNPPCDKPASHRPLVPLIIPTTSETFRQHYGREIQDLRIDMYELGEHELATIDHDENRVYHIGLNTGGSYSGRFANKPLLPKLEELLAGALGSNAERQAKHPGIRRRSSSSDESVTISGSPVTEPSDIPQLDGGEEQESDRDTVPVHKPDETGGANGNNGGLQASRWATMDHEVAQPRPARLLTPEPGQDETDEDRSSASPASIDSAGEWRHPPRRIQYIASFIEPSATLPAEYRAAVFLWKAASKTQLSWEQHLEKLRCLREDHTGTSLLVGQIEKDFQIENDDYDEEEIRIYEAQTGLRKKDCYGNMLTVVLAWVRCEH